MRITYRGDYALRAVLDLAMHYNQGVVTIHELAKRADAPAKFLEQVLLDLKKGRVCREQARHKWRLSFIPAS